MLIPTVAFTPPDSPAKHLGQFLSEPVELWGFTMNGPASHRRVDNSESNIHLGIYDFGST
jgi:hypothetical protein